MTLELGVLVLPAFADLADLPAETAPWTAAYDLSAECSLDGLTRPLRHTESGLGVVPTGVGKASAATTTAALFASDRLDLTDTLILSVGVAGAPPAVPLGSVVVSNRIVDWDNKCRFNDEPAINPYTDGDGHYDLEDSLVAEIEQRGSNVALTRAGEREPQLLTGTNLCGDELWHGEATAKQAKWLVEQHDAEPYRVTEMEDAGTAAALERFGRLDSYCAIRGVSNHDRPTDGQSPRASFFDDEFEAGFATGVENAGAVARAVVNGRLR